LREAFRQLLQDKRQEYDRRLGQFRGFWTEALPQLLEVQLLEAQRDSTERMRSYLRSISGFHHATLQAAVNRGGAFKGARRIDLANDLAICFDSAIAERWGTPILLSIRERSQQFANDSVQLLQEVTVWVEERNSPNVAVRLKLHLDTVQADARNALEVSQDRTGELRDRINRELVTALERPIRTACETFIDSQLNKGRGVRQRIVDLFAEIGETVPGQARCIALPLLRNAVSDAAKSIRKLPIFQRHPLCEAEKVANELVAEPTPEVAVHSLLELAFPRSSGFDY